MKREVNEFFEADYPEYILYEGTVIKLSKEYAHYALYVSLKDTSVRYGFKKIDIFLYNMDEVRKERRRKADERRKLMKEWKNMFFEADYPEFIEKNGQVYKFEKIHKHRAARYVNIQNNNETHLFGKMNIFLNEMKKELEKSYKMNEKTVQIGNNEHFFEDGVFSEISNRIVISHHEKNVQAIVWEYPKTKKLTW